MSIFSFFKSFDRVKKRRQSFLIMSKYELLNLKDEELLEAIQERLIALEEAADHNIEKLIDSFCIEKTYVYTNLCFLVEMNEGGLGRYLNNTSRFTSPYILDSLTAVKAKSIRNLLFNFTKEFKIDLNNTEAGFDKSITEAIFSYPYDEFDNEYFDFLEQQDLEQLVVNYIREHIDCFENQN